MRPSLVASVFLSPVIIGFLVHVSHAQGDPNCTYLSNGPPVHYFDSYMEASFNTTCGQLCTLSLPPDLLQLVELKVFFGPNETTGVNCSWILPGIQNNSLSTVILFEQSHLDSLAHGILCNEASPSLTVHDSSSVGGNLTNPYTICREHDKQVDAYSRRSSRLGNVDTVITLNNYDVTPGENLTLLKYVTVDWSEDCREDYQTDVESPGNWTALGRQWFTSNLRFPNGLHCTWMLSNPSSDNDLTRVRVRVLARTSIPGSCNGDDYILIKENLQSQNPVRFTLCDDSTAFFFATLSKSVYLDFYSGAYSGAPEFKFTYSFQDPCPQESQSIMSDVVENALYAVSDPQLSYSTCRWKVDTDWANNVLMLTRLDRSQFQQDCGDGDYLQIDLGSTVRRLSLCEDTPMPLWSDERSVDVQFFHTRSSRRQVVLYYKSVPKVLACQGIPQRLEALFRNEKTVLNTLSNHRLYRDDAAPDCRWLIVPSSQLTNTEEYAAQVFISDIGPSSNFHKINTTTAAWMISGFRAYAGTSVSTNASLTSNCYYVSRAVECQFLSTTDSLLLVYDPTLSKSPRLLDRISIIFEETKKVTSGQTGNALRSWHAQMLSAVMAVMLMVVL